VKNGGRKQLLYLKLSKKGSLSLYFGQKEGSLEKKTKML